MAASSDCKNLSEKGFGDWYLPTQEELLFGFAVIEGISFTTDDLWTRSRTGDGTNYDRMEIMVNTDIVNSAQFPKFNNADGNNYKCRCVR